MIGAINGYRQSSPTQTTDGQQRIQLKNDNKQNFQGNNKDVVEIGSTIPAVIYTKADCKKLNASEIEILQSQAEKNYENLRSLVEKLLAQQGYASVAVANQLQKPFEIDQETIVAAKQAISDEGEYGVQAVSDRLVNFAIAISGNDKEKFETLKSAIKQGFAEAERVWGGKLPDICQKTYQATMDKLDQWKHGE